MSEELTDGTVSLRSLALEDAGAHLAGEDEELVRWLNGGPGTVETVRRHIEHAVRMWAEDGPVFSFGIRLVAGDALVGTIDVQLHQPYLGERQANLAYGLYPAGRGRGLATQAVLLAVEFLRRRGDVDEVVIRTEPGNPASAAVAKRAGFRFSHSTDDDQGRFDWYVLPVSGGIQNRAFES